MAAAAAAAATRAKGAAAEARRTVATSKGKPASEVSAVAGAMEVVAALAEGALAGQFTVW
jgi:hypothetical protein